MPGEIENLKIIWPEKYKWKIASNQEDASADVLELVGGNENVERCTIMETMMSIKGTKNIQMDEAIATTFDQAKQNAPKGGRKT